MKLSFIVPGPLRQLPFEELAQWAADAGFDAIDAETDFDADAVTATRKAGIALGPMRIRASLADSDPTTRAQALDQAVGELDLAVELGMSTVWTLPRNFRNDATQRANFEAAVHSLRRLVSEAERRSLRIAIENCPFDGQNAVCTPEVWDALFEQVPSEALGICMDPSHCVWQGIDHLRALREYRQRIIHVHAKDTEIMSEGQYRYGVAGPQLEELGKEAGQPPDGWWRHRLPGLGAVDWNAFLTTLVDLGYDDVVSVEHEDPLRGQSIERVRTGLSQARRHLGQFVPTA